MPNSSAIYNLIRFLRTILLQINYVIANNPQRQKAARIYMYYTTHGGRYLTTQYLPVNPRLHEREIAEGKGAGHAEGTMGQQKDQD